MQREATVTFRQQNNSDISISTMQRKFTVPFSLQQWLHERASMLRYMSTACYMQLEYQYEE